MASVSFLTPRAPDSGAYGPDLPRWTGRLSALVARLAENRLPNERPRRAWGVYVANISDRAPHKLPTKLREASDPEWSHDGKWIYFRAYEGVGHQLYRCPAQGGDALLLAASQDLIQSTESADGKVLYVLSRNADAIMMMLPLDRPGAAPQPVPGMPNVFSAHRWTAESDGIYFISQSAPHTMSFTTSQPTKLTKFLRPIAIFTKASPFLLTAATCSTPNSTKTIPTSCSSATSTRMYSFA
jgi:hypothetical protein